MTGTVDTALVNTVLNLLLLIVGVPLLIWVARRVDNIATRFERLDVAVVGIDGRSGIVGELARIRDWKHDDLTPWAQTVSTRLAVLEEKTGAAEEVVGSEREARLELERRMTAPFTKEA